MNLFKALTIFIAVAFFSGTLFAQIPGPGFAGLQISVIGSLPGVPPVYGGITFKYDNNNTLLAGGEANYQNGSVYSSTVARDASCHITSVGSASFFATAGDPAGSSIDGGLMYEESSHVLFYVSFSNAYLGQIKPGSTAPDKMISLMNTPGYVKTGGVYNESTGSIAFVPSGFAGAGRLKIASWTTGRFYDATITPDGSGTFDISIVSVRDMGFDIEGMVYIKGGCSIYFPHDAVLIGSFNQGNVYVFDIDALGNPILASRRLMVSGITKYEGAAIDPVTGDFLFVDWGGGNRVVKVQDISCSKNVIPAPNVPAVIPGGCPGATFDLTKITATNTPVGATLTWHTATPVNNGNLVGNPSAVSPGTYYASFYAPNGVCGNSISVFTTPVTVTKGADVVPSFAQVNAICTGAHLDDLPTTSINGITGTWSPALNNSTTTVYTFTPNAGQSQPCVTIATITIPVIALPVYTDLNTGCTGGILNGVTVNATVSAGTLEYNIDGGPFQASNNFNTVTAGTHTFDIRVLGSLCKVSSGVKNITCACPVVSSNNISADQTIDIGTIPLAIAGSSALVNPSAPFVYQWQSSTDGIAWSDIAGATAKDFSPQLSIKTTQYRRLVQIPGCVNDISNTVKISIIPPLPLKISCATAPFGSVSFAWNIPYGTTSYTYSYSVNGGTPVTGPVGINSLIVTGLNPNDIVMMTVTALGANSTEMAGSSCSASGCPGITNNTISADQAICSGSTPASLTGAVAAFTFVAPFTYQWQSSADGVTWNDIAGATAKDFSPSTLTSSFTYRRLVKVPGCNNYISNTVTVTVNQPQQLKINCASPVFGNARFAWNDVATNYTYSYSVNAGTPVTGTTNSTAINITGLKPNDAVSITVTPIGACALGGTGTCNAPDCPSVTNNIISASQSICNGSAPATLSGPVAALTLVAPFSYQWQSSKDGNVWNDIAGAVAKDFASASLSQTVWYQRLVKMPSCSNNASNNIIITVKPNLIPAFSFPTTYCQKAPAFMLPGLSDNGVKGTWNTIFISTQIPGTQPYLFTPAQGECVTGPVRITATIKKLPQIFSLGNDTGLCKSVTDVPLLLLNPNITDTVNYLWQNGSTEHQYQVNAAGTYSLTISNSCGSFSDAINVLTGAVFCELFMPNVFTPNGDGKDDVFRVKYPFPVKTFSFTIYNRWGQKIFDTNDIYKGWDGKINGVMQSTDTFVWLIQLTHTNGKPQFLKGAVMLVR